MNRAAKLSIEDYVNELVQGIEPPTRGASEPESARLESLLKGKAVELWSTSSGRLFIVADDEDAALVEQPRGIVHTAAEVRRVVRIGDPAIVREIHEWKRQFNGCIRYRRE